MAILNLWRRRWFDRRQSRPVMPVVYFPHIEQFAADVKNELARARAKHPTPMRSVHEGFAVLLEEVNEVQAEVFKSKRDAAHLREELVQVAAMAQRMAEDLGLAESRIARRRKGK